MSLKTEKLQLRIAEFALSVETIVNRLPGDLGSQNLARQIIKSSTSPIANYCEASEAESAADYIHKMKICLKELRETRGWLFYATLRARGRLKLASIEKECGELIAIFVTCIRKASATK